MMLKQGLDRFRYWKSFLVTAEESVISVTNLLKAVVLQKSQYVCKQLLQKLKRVW